MNSLLELARIITRRKIARIEVFDQDDLKNQQSKFSQFYLSLLEGKYRNDREAAADLYQCLPTADKYRQLKSRFRKRLLNTLFFMDVNESVRERDRIYYDLQRDWALINILMQKGATQTALEMCRQLFQASTRQGFHDLVLLSGALLNKLASSRNDLALAEATLASTLDSSRKYLLELQAESLLNTALQSKGDSLQALYHRFEIEILQVPAATGNPRIQEIRICLQMHLHRENQDWEALIQVAREVLPGILETAKQTGDKKYAQDVFLQQTLAQFNLGRYDDAFKSLVNMEYLFQPGKPEWYVVMDLLGWLLIREKQFGQVVALCERILQEKSQDLASQEKSQRAALRLLWILGLQLADSSWNRDKLFQQFFPARELQSGTKTFAPLRFWYELIQIFPLMRQRQIAECVWLVDKLRKGFPKKDGNRSFQRFREFLEALESWADEHFLQENYPEHITLSKLIITDPSQFPELIPFETFWESFQFRRQGVTV